jgi:hypothetical protein
MDNHPPKHRINIIRKTPGAVKLSVSILNIYLACQQEDLQE